MEEKSMGQNNFYPREDLDAEEIVYLIRLWEYSAGESFTDYCSFSASSDKNFLKFLEKVYPILYTYHLEVAEGDWLDYCIQYVVQHCEDYCTGWVPGNKCRLSDKQYELALYPLAEFILKDDETWEDFVYFFTSGRNTCSGTPYFDEWRISNSMK